MKRFWQYWLSVVATASIATSASAQQGCDTTGIGSYQSIMSRAGINQGGYEMQPRAGAWSSSGQVVDSLGVADGNLFHGQAPQTQVRSIVGGQVQGGAANGGVINGGGQVYNGAVRSTPMTAAPAHAAPVYGGVASGSMVAGQTGYFDQGCDGDFVDGSMAGGSSAHWVGGVRALFFTRTGESPIPLTRNAGGAVLLSTVNDYGTMPGAEAVLTRRTCNDMGLELRYWGLYPNQNDYTFNGPGLDSYLLGLNDFLIAPGAVNVLTYFNAADNHRVYRNNEVNNLEINGLRNGGSYTTFGGRTATYELLAGARWFQFNEDYRIAAFGAGPPTQINYDLATRNTLLGFQLGARNERCLSDRMSLIGGTRVGLFNNRSTARQSIYNETGNFAYLSGDPTAEYNFESQRDSLAMLGELDLGVGYRFTEKMRASIGYRLIGVSGVALAPNQIPRVFTNNAEINRVKSNDSLILGGGYVGLDMCF